MSNGRSPRQRSASAQRAPTRPAGSTEPPAATGRSTPPVVSTKHCAGRTPGGRSRTCTRTRAVWPVPSPSRPCSTLRRCTPSRRRSAGSPPDTGARVPARRHRHLRRPRWPGHHRRGRARQPAHGHHRHGNGRHLAGSVPHAAACARHLSCAELRHRCSSRGPWGRAYPCHSACRQAQARSNSYRFDLRWPAQHAALSTCSRTAVGTTGRRRPGHDSSSPARSLATGRGAPLTTAGSHRCIAADCALASAGWPIGSAYRFMPSGSCAASSIFALPRTMTSLAVSPRIQQASISAHACMRTRLGPDRRAWL